MSPPRIVYVGPALSGRSRSLVGALNAGGTPANWLTMDRHVPHEIRLGSERLEAVISTAREMRVYESGAAPGVAPQIVREIDWICGADGILFVADSQVEREEENVSSMNRLRRDLAERGKNIDDLPVVLQANKRDLTGLLPLETLWSTLSTRRCVMVESVATSGNGVLEALSQLVRLMRPAQH